MATDKPTRVLLIEAEDEVREVTQAILETASAPTQNYEVIAVASGEEGLQVFQERGKEIDLVLTDWKMGAGQLSGMDVAKEIRQMEGGNTVSILLMTGGHLDKEQIAEAKQSGLDAVIYKPFSIGKLMDIVEKMEQLHASRLETAHAEMERQLIVRNGNLQVL